MKKLAIVGAAFAAGLVLVAIAVAGANRNWSTHANGSMEVPVRDTQGQAQAIFHLSKEGDSLSFKLIASNIEDVTQAHIHCGPPGLNGPIVVFLYGFGPTVSPNGVLSEGTATDDDVIDRTAAQCPGPGGAVDDLQDVIDRMNNGGAYVNVHTIVFPGGEIRGDVK
jgi:hypothetical protein